MSPSRFPGQGGAQNLQEKSPLVRVRRNGDEHLCSYIPKEDWKSSNTKYIVEGKKSKRNDQQEIMTGHRNKEPLLKVRWSKASYRISPCGGNVQRSMSGTLISSRRCHQSLFILRTKQIP